jgi:membrane protein implicated in regulation of membrane protease activity
MPVVVWAASFFGASVGMIAARRVSALAGLTSAVAGAVFASALAAFAWWRLLRVRRSPDDAANGDQPPEEP